MAQMIPPIYDSSIVSEGEKQFFHQLESLEGEYTVLHSLGLAYHRDKVIGEIDFVIISHEGVLCLEIKGGHVTREQGLWYFTNRYGGESKKTEGPFRQAYGAMILLRKHLGEQFGYGNPIFKCQYVCGVVFADMPFNQKGPDVIPEIVFDTRRPLNGIGIYIKEVFKYWRERLEEAHGFQGGTLSPKHIIKLVHYLRGDFGFVPSLGHTVTSTKEQLLALTKEQADRLAIASEKLHILLRGGAGTGKTLLSMEHSKRMSALGRRVLFLCYNKNLARILREKCSELEPSIQENITVNHFHEFVHEYLKANNWEPERSESNDNLDEFFGAVLPESFFELCELHGFDEPYDVLVVDEGQDLLCYEYI